MRKTVGLSDVLREALEPLRDRIQLAFIFGSWAAGESANHSDVDLMVIGDVTLRDLAATLRAARGVMGRETNPVTMTVTEFARRTEQGDRFVGTVLSRPMIFLIGGPDELSRLTSVGPPAEA